MPSLHSIGTPVAAEPRGSGSWQVLHASTGRLRVHLTVWPGRPGRLARRLCLIPGVTRAEVNPATRNVLLLFDTSRTTAEAILAVFPDSLTGAADAGAADGPEPPAGDPAAREARISVPGLTRDPSLGTRLVEHLQTSLGAQARVSLLTSEIQVVNDPARGRLGDVRSAILGMLPQHVPGEDNPRHPLDPGPLRDGVIRVVGAVGAMSLLTLQQLIAPQLLGVGALTAAATVAGVFNLVQGVPVVREAIRTLLGRAAADTLTSGGGIFSLMLANMPVGLAAAGLEGFILGEEVMARRAAWRRYEENIDTNLSVLPGAVIRLEAGCRVPRLARVVEGKGTALGAEGRPVRVLPGDEVSGGTLLLGGPFVLALQHAEPIAPLPPAAARPALADWYFRLAVPVALTFAAAQGLRTGSWRRAFEALLLLNPRPAVMGMEATRLFAAGRALRGGVTIAAMRPNHPLLLPDAILLDGPRLLIEGVEVHQVIPIAADSPPSGEGAAVPVTPDRLLELAAAVSEAAGAPWGSIFATKYPTATHGAFDGWTASARVEGVEYQLCPAAGESGLLPFPSDDRTAQDCLILRQAGGPTLGLLSLRPRLATGLGDLIAACRSHGVELVVVATGGRAAAQALAHRAGVAVHGTDIVAEVRDRQSAGKTVAVVSDGGHAAAAFACCDLAIGLSHGHSGLFPTQADILVPDLAAVSSLVEAGAGQRKGTRDAVVLGAISNLTGLALGLRGPLRLDLASLGGYVLGLTAVTAGWYRLRGGARPRSALAYLTDPRPERWGRRTIDDALRAFATTVDGLSSGDARARRPVEGRKSGREELLGALRNQVRAPITALLTGGACLTLILGQPLNTALLGFTITMNVAAGVWQERQVGKAAEALKRMSAASARVLRDGRPTVVPATEVVLGDVLVLGPGNRVAADALLISAGSLEVAEAALTGESIPIAKGPDHGVPSRRVVLEGSDVVSGTGHAVVVAVGRHTRLGATAAALNFDPGEESQLGVRLGQVLRIGLPVSLAGGVLVTLAGTAYGVAPLGQLMGLGVATALSAIPEGLPLLAGVGQAAVAQRLAKQNVLVRRLAGIEALGRVDVTCSDKTGTLTEGRLSVALLADAETETAYPGSLGEIERAILLAAALASPHPDAPHSTTHPTDAAVLRAAESAGLGAAARAVRQTEVPFDSARALHVSAIGDRLWVKGAPERVLARCTSARRGDTTFPLDDAVRGVWFDRAAALAERGLRVLLVAAGPQSGPPDNPQNLTALGFIGIRDPLRPGVPEAVARCQRAGIRIIMLTGDHPATARTIGREAGLLVDGGEVVTAADLVSLPDAALDARLDRVAVIARAAPLDKLRFVESLRRRGHTVAMTGDGVNDAPSLRLADVGVAMGRGGTEVARQASDVVLADDNFASLVEALVEGRGFWRNMRTGVGLLVGGNAGELGMIVGAAVLGYGSPLTAPQILMVNLITDTLPSLAILLQRPQHRDLAALSREGVAALDVGLRRDALHRGLATGIPSLAAYVLAHAQGGPVQAGAVGFASVITTQLAQALDAGRVQGFLSRSVVGAVAGSLGLMATTYAIPPLRTLFNLTVPTPMGIGYVGAASAGAVVLSRVIGALAPAGGHPGPKGQ